MKIFQILRALSLSWNNANNTPTIILIETVIIP